jgi:3-deoxy-7-phosphoheptulonate synthase
MHPSTSSAPTDAWSPSSWRAMRAQQQPAWPDRAALQSVLDAIRALPPLVTSGEVESLKSQLAAAARGERFVLQGGDCAESFADCTSDRVASQLKLMLQMSLVLVHELRVPVVRIGRMAGQYAKPRTSDTETRDGVTLPSYRGDNVNSPDFNADARTPDPALLMSGYERAAITLNFMRSLADSGFADLHHPEQWDLEWMSHSPLGAEYRGMVESIGDSLRHIEAIEGITPGAHGRVEFHASHECLLLELEESLVRTVPRREGHYLLSTHMPWIGLRTASPSSAHVEFLRGVANPVGVKVGPDTAPADAVEMVRALNPRGEPGKVALIHRMGARRIAATLPAIVRAVAAARLPVLWICDPMHGNTEIVTPSEGAWAGRPIKTRKFAHIVAEIEQAIEVHASCGTVLGGMHFELTGDRVTECTGGARGLSDEQLARAYRSQIDPRLNSEQSLEVAMLVARRLRSSRLSSPVPCPDRRAGS